MDKLKQFLRKNEFEFYEDFDISQISSMKIGSKVKMAIFPKTVSQLEKLLLKIYSRKLAFKVFGNLSNVLVINDEDAVFVITSKMNEELTVSGNYVQVSAGMLLPKFCELVRKYNFKGVEGLSGIPATIGGAIKNNAGAFGYSISLCLEKIKVFQDGEILEILKSDIKFTHHYSNLNRFVILEASFLFENENECDIINLTNKFTYLRGKTQPLGLSLGSVFKKVNGKSAGFYIERSGLKGFRVGGIIVSNKHANFFVNDKGGSVTDFLRLLAYVQVQVERQFGVCLSPEIEKVGDFNETFSRPSHTFEI